MTVDELRTKEIADLGYTNFFGTPKSWDDLTPEQRSRVTDGMSQYIAANPEGFNPVTVANAQRWVSSGIVGQGYEDTSAGADIKTFFDEVGNQATSLNENLNPFSEQNRGKVLWVAVAIGAAYILAPVIIDAIRRSKVVPKAAP